MRFFAAQRAKSAPEQWHTAFALLPVRISAHELVWLETYERRREVLSEGNWAGGFRWRWRYRDKGREFAGQEHGN